MEHRERIHRPGSNPHPDTMSETPGELLKPDTAKIADDIIDLIQSHANIPPDDRTSIAGAAMQTLWQLAGRDETEFPQWLRIWANCIEQKQLRGPRTRQRP